MAKLYFRYGAMNSGKSTALMQVAHNYEEQGMRVLILKPQVDTKGGGELVSRLGVRRRADLLIPPEVDVFEAVRAASAGEQPLACVLCDESQFFTPEQADRLNKIEAASNHLLEIINSILDLSKIDAGKLTLNAEIIQIQKLLANVVSIMNDRVRDEAMAARIEAAASTWRSFEALAMSIASVMANGSVTSNATMSVAFMRSAAAAAMRMASMESCNAGMFSAPIRASSPRGCR